MAIVNTNTFLSTLIGTGADASLNLFVVNIKPHSSTQYDSTMSCRVTNFPVPKRDLVTTDLNYQNIKIVKPVAGTDLDKTIQFNVRLDENYNLLKTLRNNQCVDNLGNFYLDETKKFNIYVDALKPYTSLLNSEKYASIYRWEFVDCYILTVGSFTFNYNSSESTGIPVKFVYSYCNEAPVKNSEISTITADTYDTLNNYYTGNSLFKK